MCELKWDDIYVDASGRQLTYTFIGGKSYHRCILVFTYSEHILPYFDEIVSI